jgi:hypothetical protein
VYSEHGGNKIGWWGMGSDFNVLSPPNLAKPNFTQTELSRKSQNKKQQKNKNI